MADVHPREAALGARDEGADEGRACRCLRACELREIEGDYAKSAFFFESVASAVLPIDVAGDIPAQVRQNLARLLAALTENDEVQRVLFAEAAGIDEEGDEGLRGFYRAVTKRLATAISTGQALGVVTEGNPLILARLLLGMIREPVFQAWLYGETLDVEAVVDALASVMRTGMVGR